MIEMPATVRNEQGIHCRPSVVILKAVSEYGGEVQVQAPAGTSDLRSVMELMSLALQRGTQICLRVSGPDEEAMCRKLVELFETEFDFPPRKPGEVEQALEQVAKPAPRAGP